MNSERMMGDLRPIRMESPWSAGQHVWRGNGGYNLRGMDIDLMQKNNERLEKMKEARAKVGDGIPGANGPIEKISFNELLDRQRIKSVVDVVKDVADGGTLPPNRW